MTLPKSVPRTPYEGKTSSPASDPKGSRIWGKALVYVSTEAHPQAVDEGPTIPSLEMGSLDGQYKEICLECGISWMLLCLLGERELASTGFLGESHR